MSVVSVCGVCGVCVHVCVVLAPCHLMLDIGKKKF